MRFSILAFALLFAASCSTAPPPAPAPAPPRLIDQMTRIEMVPAGGYAFSRDGRTLIFSAEVGGATKAFSASVFGGSPTLLNEDGDLQVVSYFPNDDRILVRFGQTLAVRERDETVHALTAGEFKGWCSDGSVMIATTRSLLRLDGASYQQRVVFALPSSTGPGATIADAINILDRSIDAVSRDCRTVAIGSRQSGVYFADLSNANATAQVAVEHEANTAYRVLGFTPTNRSLNYARREGVGFQEAFRFQLSDGQIYPVMQTQADVMAIEFSPTGRYGAYYSGANGHISDIAVVDQTSDAAVPLSSGTRDLRFNRDETKIAFRLANDGWPADIFVSDLDGSHITRLVHAPNAH